MKTFILDKRTKVFHDVKCECVAAIDNCDRGMVDLTNTDITGLIPCSHCRTLTYIFEKNSEDYISQMKSMNLTYRLTPYWLLVQTEISFWKIGFDAKRNRFYLFHGNKSPISSEVLDHAHSDYHRQGDVRYAYSITKYLRYIHSHDVYRKREDGDIRVLTYGKRHKNKLAKRIKNKRRRKELARTYEILGMLEQERRNKEAS